MVRPVADLFQAQDYPSLLVGLAQPDDAAVYRLSDTQAVISTADFFPPVVDDPYAYGAIAAANALSDVYAMGGDPLFAINLAAWPDNVSVEILAEVLRGGAEKVKESGAVIAGGHTITDQEPKYGLAVTGLVHPDHIFTKGGAQPGDKLVLTKALGTGTITTAHKRGRAAQSDLDACIASMTRLNRKAASVARDLGSAVHAVTDITGFGLMGHSHEMAHLSGCALQFTYGALPWLPGAQGYAMEWIFPGGSERNDRYYSGWVTVNTELKDWQQRLLFDPQTSGGLLLALTPAAAEEFLKRAPGWVVGEALAGQAGTLTIV